MERSKFTGSLGFVLAAAGSAVGLGNIWRFPYLAAKDGGGIFLLCYLILALTFGFALLTTEIAIGRKTGQSPLTAYSVIHPKAKWIGVTACVIPTIILPYYMNMRYFDPLGLVSAFNSVFDRTVTINLVGKNLAFYLPSLFGSGIRSGLYIYIFRQFFEGMDKALEESAQIDGCGPLRTFLSIMLPNARNSIVTVFLFSFVWHFNDYYLTKQLLGTSRRTLIVALSSLRIDLAALIGGQTAFDPIRIQTRIQAGCLLAIVPMFLLYIFAQRKLADSIEHIGIK